MPCHPDRVRRNYDAVRPFGLLEGSVTLIWHSMERRMISITRPIDGRTIACNPSWRRPSENAAEQLQRRSIEELQRRSVSMCTCIVITGGHRAPSSAGCPLHGAA